MSRPSSPVSLRRAPKWIRILLMLLLIAFASLAFYLNFLDYIQQVDP